MMRENGVGKPTFHYLAEDDEEEQVSGGLNHLVQRNAGRAQWTWKRGTVVVDSEAAEKEHVSRKIHRGNAEIEELWTASHVRHNSCWV